jgi:hypothetical protein
MVCTTPKLSPQISQRRLGVTQRLHRLRVRVAAPHDIAVLVFVDVVPKT